MKKSIIAIVFILLIALAATSFADNGRDRMNQGQPQMNQENGNFGAQGRGGQNRQSDQPNMPGAQPNGNAQNAPNGQNAPLNGEKNQNPGMNDANPNRGNNTAPKMDGNGQNGTPNMGKNENGRGMPREYGQENAPQTDGNEKNAEGVNPEDNSQNAPEGALPDAKSDPVNGNAGRNPFEMDNRSNHRNGTPRLKEGEPDQSGINIEEIQKSIDALEDETEKSNLQSLLDAYKTALSKGDRRQQRVSRNGEQPGTTDSEEADSNTGEDAKTDIESAATALIEAIRSSDATGSEASES